MKTKYLIIRLSSIGDIVLTTPVVRCLKKQVDNAEVHFVTKQKYVSIVNSNPYIDKVHVLGENINSLHDNLAHEKFDYVIDLHHNIRSYWIKRRLKVPSFTFTKLNFRKYLLICFKINRLPKKHVVDRYLETLAGLNIKYDGKGLDFFIPENKGFKMDELPGPFQNGFVAFVIAGTYFTKKLPVDKVSEICNLIDFPVILLGGKTEFDEGEMVIAKSKGNVINYAGKITLNQSASLVREANLVLTNDTGLMHISAAFNKKILSFWGNTVPDFGMFPYQAHPSSIIIERNDLKCRPCSKLGHQKCPKKHFKCMDIVNIQKIVDWVNQNYNS